MGSGDDCEHNHPLMSPNSAVAVCPDCGGHMWHDDEYWQHATGGASVLAAEVQRLRAAMTEARTVAKVWRAECLSPACWNRPIAPRDLFFWEPSDTPKGGA